MPLPNPKNVQTNAAAGDLGLGLQGLGEPTQLDDEEDKKRKMLQKHRESMGAGFTGGTELGNAAMMLFSGA